MSIKVLKLLLIFFLLTGCTSGSFKGESRGNTMKRYLHYCTYEIWDGFKEYLDYRFMITPKGGGYISIMLKELPKTDKLDNLIDLDIAKHKAELKKYEYDEYFGEVHREKIKIGNNPAVIVSYEFNKRRKKGEKDFNEYLRKAENCYIKLKDKTLLLEGSTFTKSYNKTVKDLWEEFYKSYKEDDSQAFRTNYGSFKWVNGLKDESSIKYLAYNKGGDLVYSIDISYLSEDDKIEIEKSFSFTEKIFEVLLAKATVSKERGDKLIVDGYKIEYNEFNIKISNGEKRKKADIWIFDFTPGVIITIDEERENYFGLYRNEINAMINSIKFYPDLKK
ncbi:MAG: hypothetical protein FWF73_03000 [Spirochaetes bacterium]|nr:hypothetical protein [Spirochaetota bacterium]